MTTEGIAFPPLNRQKNKKSMTLTESPIYFSECLTDDYAFYIAPRTIDHVDTTTDTWFRGQRVGMKKISQIMKTMATGADLPKEKKLTNTSARKRLVQKLRDSGIEATSIAQISGIKAFSLSTIIVELMKMPIRESPTS